MILRRFYLVHDEARSRVGSYALEAPEGTEVIFREKKRDNDANAALHATLTEVAERRTWVGKHWTVEAWKRLFVAAWMRATGRTVEMAPAIDGFGIDVIYSPTSEMSQREVAELIEFINAWDAQQP